MFRLLTITIISFISIVPFLAFFHRFLELNDNIAGYFSFALAWILTPFVLLRIWRAKPGLETLPVDPDDPIMQEYIAISRNHLPRFINELAAGKLETYIKFPHSFGDEIEHVWGLAHSCQNNEIITSIASDPVGEIQEKDMGRLKISYNDVEDWMLINEKGEIQGGYTMLAMAKIYEREYGKLPRRYINDLSSFLDFKWEG